MTLAPVCPSCWAEIKPLEDPGCPRCGDWLPPSPENHAALCRACRLAPPPFVQARSYGLYDGRLRAAIHTLKFDHTQALSRGLGRLLAHAIAPLEDETPDGLLLVPIPLHRSKLALRGFNQARTLATEALRALRRTHPSWRLQLAPRTLMRLRATESQAGLTPRLRRQNLRGAFSVADRAALAGRDLLLIDDILTTGATLRSAADTLLRSGARAVWAATLARARTRRLKPGSECFAEFNGWQEWPEGSERIHTIHTSRGDSECR